MHSIFLSYSSKDRRLAHRVASGLLAQGLSVWYDKELAAGAAYRSAIQAALDAADIVLVLWTPAAAESAWVRDEADAGSRRGKLFSIACERTAVPTGYRRSVFARIGNARSGPTSAELSALASAIRYMSTATQTSGQLSRKHLVSRFADLTATSAIFAVLVFLAGMYSSDIPAAFASPIGFLIVSPIVGLALGGVGYASSRLFDHLALRVTAVSRGPSLGRLVIRWFGEALGVSLLLMLTMLWKHSSFLNHGAFHDALMFVVGLIFMTVGFALALATKYLAFILCKGCRYFLLT